ncbi:hypothetical protein IHE49_07030 [Rhodanobacter sp. 7MK24]|uniref:hypothetical protein n=1 Tax=Rhodanobacter sp. 7MK24 TaxID=2775922 RepID=UPI00178518EF|nr:hypothetical protein [Rhodanobacter sp. 7MK24]MBD8880230.1 hypothetical protein [Rhodanobacter sp. 7MK24]
MAADESEPINLKGRCRMCRRLFVAAFLMFSGVLYAADSSSGSNANELMPPHWLSIEYGGDYYASKLGDFPFSVQAPYLDEPAAGVQPDDLPDHGAKLRSIRQAFADGFREGLAKEQGSTACGRNGHSRLFYWVLFKDGTYIQGIAKDVVTLKHVPAAWHWAPTFPETGTTAYNVANMRIAGLVLGSMYRQPCADDGQFLAMGHGQLYLAHHSLTGEPPAPPAPPPPPPSMVR